MTQDLHETTIGVYEKQFADHNRKQEKEKSSFFGLTMLPLHMAIDLVEKGLWDQNKDRYLVILKK